jgi:DNA-binding transcriptional ArsR family regulator
MLAFVPVAFDAYRPLKPYLRWTLQCLVGFADRTGRCFPSVRKLAEVAGLSKSTAARHLTELAKVGVISRQRRLGGVYIYRIESRVLPVSHARRASVPRIRAEEDPIKKIPDSGLPNDQTRWQARVRSWKKSGFWLPQWGPKPGEAGCFAPVV